MKESVWNPETSYVDLSIISEIFSILDVQKNVIVNFFRDSQPGGYDGERENCELSDRDSRDLEVDNPEYFDNTGNYDYYERALTRQGVDGECLDGKCQ